MASAATSFCVAPETPGRSRTERLATTPNRSAPCANRNCRGRGRDHGGHRRRVGRQRQRDRRADSPNSWIKKLATSYTSPSDQSIRVHTLQPGETVQTLCFVEGQTLNGNFYWFRIIKGGDLGFVHRDAISVPADLRHRRRAGIKAAAHPAGAPGTRRRLWARTILVISLVQRTHRSGK